MLFEEDLECYCVIVKWFSALLLDGVVSKFESVSFSKRMHILSSKLLLIVSSIESTNEELMYTIRRGNQITREVMQTLIEETKRATNISKALLEKSSATINTTVQQCTNELKTEFREAIPATLKIQNNKDEVKSAIKKT